jgi:hypothetical protein
MKNKFEKYIWVVLCFGIASYHIAIFGASAFYGFHNTGLVFTNIAYMLIFTTAIIRELNFSKVLFDVMLALSILALVYGLFFSPSFF